MQDLGLGSADRNKYEAALVSSPHQWWQAYFWHRDRTHAATIVLFQDGQVNLDCTQLLTDGGSTGSMWSTTLTVADPENRFHLDSNVIFLDRMLRLEHWTYVDELAKAVKCPVFTGPVTKADDTGLGVIAIEAMGKEIWARGQIKTPKKYPKGAKTTDVIRHIWQAIIGEAAAWVNIPDKAHTLPDTFQIGPATVDGGWGAIQYLAGTISCDAFYDGASVGTLRDSDSAVVFQYRGDHEVVGPAPQESTLLGGVSGTAGSALQIVNVYIGTGHPKPPKGQEATTITSEAVAPKGNRFYPFSLGNPGALDGLRLTESADFPDVRLQATLDEIVALRLKRRLQVAEQATFNSVVVPHLDPFDSYQVKTTGFGRTAENMIRSTPLRWSESSPQTNGFTRRVSLPPQRFRR